MCLQLRKLPAKRFVMFARRANHHPVPRLLAAGNRQVKPTVEIGRIEAEQLPQNKARIVLERLEDPQQRILRLDLSFSIEHRLPLESPVAMFDRLSAPAAQ